MKIAFLTTDNREHYGRYSLTEPFFGTAPEALLQGLAQLPDLDVHVISCTKRPMSSPEKLADNIWFHSLTVSPIGWLRTGYQGCIRAVRRKLREIGPDLVHGQGTERDCAISAVLSGYPNVVTIHGNMAEQARLFGARLGWYGQIAAILENFTLSRTTGVFCNSRYTEDLVRRRAKRTWRVSNPIRVEFFRPLAHGKEPSNMPLFVCVGAVIPRKQQLAVLDAMETVWRQNRQAKNVFIGQADPTNEYAARFLQRLKQLEKSGRASYLGELKLAELLQQFDTAHGIIHFPSEEAFGLVVAEALARNLKLFGSRIGGLLDITDEVEGAELVDYDSPDSLAAAVIKWIDGGCLCPTNAAAIMRERYHPVRIAKQHMEIYADVLSNVR